MIECPVDEFIPLPTGGAVENFADLRMKAAAACVTADVLTDEGYTQRGNRRKDKRKAEQILKAKAEELLTETAKGTAVGKADQALNSLVSNPEGARYANALLTQYDMAIVGDAKRLRNYVTNRLILESENQDPRIRIRALELLGKVSDVGLFTERSEVTVNNRSTVELEQSLREKIRRIMNGNDVQDATLVAEPVEIPNPGSVDDAVEGI